MEGKRIRVDFTNIVRDFLFGLDEDARDKIMHNVARVEAGEVSAELFKKLRGEIWELRTGHKGMAYRLLAFWHNGAVVVATHGVVKKTDAMSAQEIERAERIREKYLQRYQKQ